MKKQLLLALLMMVFTMQSQTVTNYFFEEETIPMYMHITSGTTILTNTDDNDVENVSIGFDFKYLGITYNDLTIDANGGISFTESSVSYSNDLASSDTYKKNIIAPLWDDLYVRNEDSGEVVYKLDGTAPFRTFTVEWKNVSWRDPGNFVSFKLVLYESTNSFAFYYGSLTGNDTTRSASIGFNGASGNFLSVTPSSPSTTSTTVATNNILPSEYPALKVYRFSPPTVNDYTGDAIVLPLTTSCLNINACNVGATDTSAYTPSCGHYNGGDFWYSFTAPAYGAINIKRLTDGPWGAFSYSIHKSSDGWSTTNYQCGIITESEINDDNFIYNLIPGEEYYLRVWEYDNNDFGTVNFCVSAIENDYNSDAFEIEVQPENASSYVESLANNENATDSPNADPSCGSYNGGDVWFKFTAPSNGQLAVVHSDTAGDWSSMCFAVYTSAGGNTAVTCNYISIRGVSAPYDTKIITGLTAGTVYWLRMWDWGNDNFGNSSFYLREDTTSGIEDYTSLDFNYYPNPATNMLNVTAKENISGITLTNMMGQQVITLSPNSQEAKLNIAHLPQGIYMMNVIMGDASKTVKIIKK